VEM
jgi:hypothetical protein